MDEREFELEKLRIAEASKTEQARTEMKKWFVMLVWPPVSQLLIAYATNTTMLLPAVDKVGEKADTAATVAVETKKTTDATRVSSAASAKAWNAYLTKDETDRKVAEEAVAAAAAMPE